MVFDVVEDGGDVVVKTAFFAVGVCDLEEERGLVGCVGRRRGVVFWFSCFLFLVSLFFFVFEKRKKNK